jgi:hypothetical protein
VPRFDKTGPEGKGPLTGRGLGNCSGDTNDTSIRSFFGLRLGLGRQRRNGRRGFGRGFGRNR